MIPPDRVWLVMMRQRRWPPPLSWKEEQQPAGDTLMERYITFDRDATFEFALSSISALYGKWRGPMQYNGEFDRELGRQKR